MSQHLANRVAQRAQRVAPCHVAMYYVKKVAIVWPGLANTAPKMLRYVALRPIVGFVWPGHVSLGLFFHAMQQLAERLKATVASHVFVFLLPLGERA